MATPNVGILTTAGKALIDKVNSGQAKISFSKIVFSSMDNSQLSDMQVKALTAIAPQEVVVSSPETTLDTNSGETRIRATGTNEKLADGVYVKTYGVFAKDDTGSEILYGVTVSPNPNYFPAYDGVTPQAVTYSYKTVIQETSNITMTNSNDVYASQEDLTEALQPYAKTVDVNQQLDKKVNVADMRKPASDVAGIEEVNAKQDKIGYTPADDSTVLHNNALNQILTDNSGIIIGNDKDFGFIKRRNYKGGLAIGSSNNFHFMATHDQSLSNTSEYHDVWNIAPTGKLSILGGASFTPADDSKVVHSTDMRKPASDVAGIEEVNAKQDKIGYTPANDSKVAHLSGANNFNTVPTVNNNPLLLASSLPSDLARTGSNQEFTGKNTFDTAPIDKATGKPYITKDGVPAVPSTLADTTKDANFTGKLQKSGIDVATKSDVTTAVSTATANMVDSSKPTNFTAGLKSGGVDVATAADLKSIADKAWYQLDNQYVTNSLDRVSFQKVGNNSTVLYKIDEEEKLIYFSFVIYNFTPGEKVYSVRIDFSSIVKNISFPKYDTFNLYSVTSNRYLNMMSIDNNKIGITGDSNASYVTSSSAMYKKTSGSGWEYSQCFVSYDALV